ncbi:MAG: sulfotransferase [Xanthomonadaceae bacterium]|nr:sulfotransferase [Xanthomonadaceae bacterium]
MDLIAAAINAGFPAEAEHLCRDRLEWQPDSPDVLVLLGLSLQHQGKLADAVATFARLTRLQPEEAIHWRNYATVLQMAGALDTAEQAAEAASRLAPVDPEYLDQLGRLQLKNGKTLLARDTLLRAFGKAPYSPAIRIDAACACSACRDYRAENLLRPWREWLPLDDALQFDLACVFGQLGEANDSLEVLEDLVRRTPSHARARLLLASMYERVNRLQDAEALLNQIATDSGETEPDLRGQIARQRAQLAVRKRNYSTARQLLEGGIPGDENDCAYWFTLGSVCDRLGDARAAMRALQTAHAQQGAELRTIAPYRFEPGAEILPGAKWRVSESDYLAWPQLKAPDTPQSPVFVVGFPRSGTTLLEQMLDAHPRLQSMDERPFFNMLSNQLDDVDIDIPRDLGKLTQCDCDELRKGYVIMACSKVPRRWNSRLVDKNPMNMLWLPMIHRLFPRAKFILAVRHPCDVILSCYMQNFRAALLASAGLSLERLAHAYVESMECWLYHVGVFKPNVFVSRYEDLVADTPAQTRRIAAFLNLHEADAMLGFAERAREKGHIKTPSYTQVIEPINSRGIDRWRRYREYLEPILPILEPMLKHWGYTTEASGTATGY